jgi:DNA repair protein RecO
LPAEKIIGIITGIRPYRESSALITILSQQQGLVSGIAKGIKQNKPAGLFLERGFLLELLVYRRPHRDLQLFSTMAVMDFFETIRLDLLRSTLRDVALESIRASLVREEPHPELFDTLLCFCRELSGQTGINAHLALLWKFYHTFAKHLGFAPDLSCCVRCGKPIDPGHGCCLMSADGRCCCMQCRTLQEMSAFIPPFVLSGLFHGEFLPPAGPISLVEQRRITGLWADYCRYHCDNRYESKSLSFLYTIL